MKQLCFNIFVLFSEHNEEKENDLLIKKNI
jgi:hypothetical protein